MFAIFEINQKFCGERETAHLMAGLYLKMYDANANANIESHIKTGSCDLYQFSMWLRLFVFSQIPIRLLIFYSFISFIGSNGEI